MTGLNKETPVLLAKTGCRLLLQKKGLNHDTKIDSVLASVYCVASNAIKALRFETFNSNSLEFYIHSV